MQFLLKDTILHDSHSASAFSCENGTPEFDVAGMLHQGTDLSSSFSSSAFVRTCLWLLYQDEQRFGLAEHSWPTAASVQTFLIPVKAQSDNLVYRTSFSHV